MAAAEVTLVSRPILAMPGVEIVQVTPALTADWYTCKTVKPKLVFASFADTSTAAADSVAATIDGTYAQRVVLTCAGTVRTVNLFIVGE